MKKLLSVLAVLTLFITGCTNQSETPVGPEVNSEVSLEKKPGSATIVEIAQSNPNFSYLVQAVVIAGLAETLSSDRQLTVFAPLNSAFESLASDLGITVEQLLVPENADLLKAVVLYHVAPGQRYAKNVLASGKTITLARQFAYVKVMEDGNYIGNEKGYSKIEAVDIRAKNGVVHVINKVLLPL